MVSFNSDQLAAFDKFVELIPGMVLETRYAEIYGFDFSTRELCRKGRAQTRIIHNFLDANDYNVDAARRQFVSTLSWRRSFNPLSAACLEKHSDRYDQHLYVVKENDQIYNWNNFSIFDNPKVRKELLSGSRTQEYLRWRVGQFERAIAIMGLDSNRFSVTQAQIFDFTGINGFSFIGLGAEARKTLVSFLKLVRAYYPGIVELRYFVSIPKILSWSFILGRVTLGKEAASKFVDVKAPNLAKEVGYWVPADFGGASLALEPFSRNNEGLKVCLKRMKACGLIPITSYRRESKDSQVSASPTSHTLCGSVTSGESILESETSTMSVSTKFLPSPTFKDLDGAFVNPRSAPKPPVAVTIVNPETFSRI